MRHFIWLIVLALATPLVAVGGELDGSQPGQGPGIDLTGRMATSFDAAAAQESGNAFQFYLAPVAYVAFNSDLRELIRQPLWGGDLGMVFWFAGELGLGLSAQYLVGSGSGEIDHIGIDSDASYFNVFINLHTRLPFGNGVALYSLTGLGYSNLQIDGSGGNDFMNISIDSNSDGMAYQFGVGIEAPWIYGEFKWLESTFPEDRDGTGGVLDGLELLIGMRTP